MFSTRKKHNLNALLGITFQKNTSYYHDVSVSHITNESLGMAGLGNGDVPVVSASKGENALMSYLGRLNYNYDSKYYVTFSMRADGSSKSHQAIAGDIFLQAHWLGLSDVKTS